MKKFKAFTLVEMLIVMAILIVLMGLGIAGGRAAILRSQNLSIQAGVKLFYEAALAHQVQVGNYPYSAADVPANAPKTLTSSGGALTGYLDSGFSGGEATTQYQYLVNGTGSTMIVCAKGVPTITGEVQWFCKGNGFNDNTLLTTILGADTFLAGSAQETNLLSGTLGSGARRGGAVWSTASTPAAWQ